MTDDPTPAHGHTAAPANPATTADWFVARVLCGVIDGLCVVADLTAVGAKIMAVTPLSVDDRIILDLGQDLRVAGQVRWTDTTRCGVEFDPPLDPAILARVAGADFPAPRFRRCVAVSLERHGRQANAQLVDISPADASLSLPHEPWIREGAELEVEIAGFYPTEAEVSWIEGERIGVQFRNPIQLWRFDNQLREWGRDCGLCAMTSCHTGPQPSSRPGARAA